MSGDHGHSAPQESDTNSREVNRVLDSVDTQDELETDQRAKTPRLSLVTGNVSSPSGDLKRSEPCLSAPTSLQQEQYNENSNTCPFASMKPGHVGDSSMTWSLHGAITPRPDFLPPVSSRQESVTEDPIAAESRLAGASSPPPSVNGSLSRCPIRFLDQHSPEEVAEYFEHHKHEIPRSHEICVRRYQSNAQSIRQLDAKYGNLVSMIQGLGMKHQPILAHKEEDGSLSSERNSMEKVRNWANSVEVASEPVTKNATEVQSDPDNREGVFDRPYKEIRVGESPSRPWGISVPFAGRQALSTASVRGIKGNITVTEAVSKQASRNLSSSKISSEDYSTTAVKCFCPGPICMDAPENEFATLEQLAFHILNGHKWPTPSESPAKTKAPPPASSRPPSSSSPVKPALSVPLEGAAAAAAAAAARDEQRPQMLFTGPVFIGYPADQVSTMLQHCGGLGGAKHSSNP
ncbi:hypothetical protein MMC07_003567 [Pseudocyphellaria aurata]|nr:hypothetical protein [Pseudocyphellaria aurata]